eukprot:2310091-Amphidinium_carterae.1
MEHELTSDETMATSPGSSHRSEEENTQGPGNGSMKDLGAIANIEGCARTCGSQPERGLIKYRLRVARAPERSTCVDRAQYAHSVRAFSEELCNEELEC